MRIIGVIPARYQSSRFPGKPLTEINGRPMIWWVYHQVIKVSAIDEVYVATDSAQIFDVCKQYGIQVLMTSDQHQTGTDRLGEVAEKINADFYVNIQGDEPLIEPETIDQIITYKKENPEVQVINTMTLLHADEDVTTDTIVKVVAADNGDLLYLSRSPVPYPKRGQTIDYYKHLGLYGLTREALLFFAHAKRTRNETIEDVEMVRFLENGYRIKMVKVDSRIIGVDRPEDVPKVEEAMKKLGIRP